MKFKIGDKVKTLQNFKYSNLRGKVLAVNAKDRYLIEFKNKIGSHKLYGLGKNGYCFMIDEKFIRKGGEFDMARPSLLKRLLDTDLRLIAKKVMDSEGNLNYDDDRVQLALLRTDGFKAELVKILKEEKRKDKKKKKDEDEEENEE